MPIIEPLRATLERLTVGKAMDARLLVGPRGGVITTATLRDATGWDQLVDDLGLAGLVRHGLRHTTLTRFRRCHPHRVFKGRIVWDVTHPPAAGSFRLAATAGPPVGLPITGVRQLIALRCVR